MDEFSKNANPIAAGVAPAAREHTAPLRAWRRRLLVCAYALIICCRLPSGAAAESTEDESYIRGYVAAILQQEFKMAAPAVTVKGRLITIAGDLSDNDRNKLQGILDKNGHGQYRLVVEEISSVESFPGPRYSCRYSPIPVGRTSRPRTTIISATRP